MICTECGAEKTMRRVEDPATGERDIRWVCGRCEGDQVPPHPDPLPQERGGKKDDRYFVKALADGLSLLLAFEEHFHFRPVSLDVIAKTTRLHKAKAYRLVQTLLTCGLVEDLGGEYALHTRTWPRIAKAYAIYLDRETARVERRKREFAGLR